MKRITGFVLLMIVLSQVSEAQYYYKDLVVTRQTTLKWKTYKAGKVRSIVLNSFEGDGSTSDGFSCDQQIKGDFSQITTHTRSTGTQESWLFAWYNPAGQPIKTLDTSDTYQSQSEYQYTPSGQGQDQQLVSITNTSMETDNKLKEVEQHLWSYDAQGRPASMLKIRNGSDTTYIRFITDEKGHVAEEHASRGGAELPPVYYYYDSVGRLTDIVRYNDKAQRLLPDFVFTYDNSELPVTMLVIKEGGNDYQKWNYEYDKRGLKASEACYNRKRQLLGRIEYQYK